MMKYILSLASMALLFSCSKERRDEKKIAAIFETHPCYENFVVNDSLPPKTSFPDTAAFREKIVKENLRPFYVSDLNNDGQDDYLVNIKAKKGYKGRETILDVFPLNLCDEMGNIAIVLSQKSGKYKIFNPYRETHEEPIAIKLSPDGKFIHVLKSKYDSSKNYDSVNFYDTDVLMIKNNMATEYIKAPVKHKINNVRIEFEEKFVMTLDFKEKKMYLDDTWLNDLDADKTYFKKISKEDETQLQTLLNDMDFTQIDNSENTPIERTGNYFLDINYDSDQHKEIVNYGKNGGLRTVNFYDQILLYLYQFGWTELEYMND